MSETLAQGLTAQELLDAQIYNLAERMREYDSLMSESDTLREASAIYEAQLQEVDPGIPLDEQPPELATAALGLYIAKYRQDAFRMTAFGQKYTSVRSIAGLNGRKIKAESLDPNRCGIATTKRNEYGQEYGLGRYYSERVGRLGEISLNASDGGFARINGRSGKFYYASPIIKADYTPAFKLALF